MAEILYTYQDQVYVNLTNKCDCNCKFCIRTHHDTVGDAQTLWHKADPTLEEVKAAIDAYDFTGKSELVYCGYGEPTCALDVLTASAKYAKETYGLKIRVNTNGLGNLYHQRDIVPELAEVADVVSISLNAPTKGKDDGCGRTYAGGDRGEPETGGVGRRRTACKKICMKYSGVGMNPGMRGGCLRVPGFCFTIGG